MTLDVECLPALLLDIERVGGDHVRGREPPPARDPLAPRARFRWADVDRVVRVEPHARRLASALLPSACPADLDASTFDTELHYAFDGSTFHLAKESQAAFDRLAPRNDAE